MEKKVNRNDLIYESGKYKHGFRNVPKTRSFSDNNCNGKATRSEAD